MESPFDYKITSQKVATVLTLKGRICKDSLDKLEQCRGDVASIGTRIFIIYCKDLTSVDLAAYRLLTILQQEIRKKCNLLIVGLAPEMKAMLASKAIVRESELRRSLEEALKVA